jgi:4-hydroxy-tetrahydrodipicolinate synthase
VTVDTHQPLRGIMPVLQIPFDADDEIDEHDLRRQVDFCVASETHGLVVPALASEFMVLTDEERRRTVEIVVEQAAGRVPVVAGVAGTSVKAACAFARHARQTGAAAVMALPPYVRRPGPAGVIGFYAAIAAAADLPIVVQNAPPPFGLGISLGTLTTLLDEVPAVCYVKEERPPAGHFISELVAATGDRLLGVFGGTAGLYLMSELARGATGCMPSAAVPDVLVAVYDAVVAGDHARARQIYERVLPLLSLEMSVLMAVSKEVLRRRGIFNSVGMRDPEFPLLDQGDHAELDAIWPRLSELFVG